MSDIRIVVPASAGFCWGVERALEIARDAVLTSPAPVDTLGPLIHNPGVIAELEAEGIGRVEDPGAKTEGTIIIRSHGIPIEVKDLLEQSDIQVVDATCTFVKAAQDKAARLQAEGYTVMILGEAEHPEVLGIRSHAGPDAVVLEEPDQIPERVDGRKVGVVVQTTQSQARLAALSAALAPRVRELRVFNTICSATERRQRETVELAEGVDLVIVVGGRDSGNTARLAQLSSAVQPRSFHVEGPLEIRREWLDGVDSVGVTAGASTPPAQIEAVVARIREFSS